jgi:hypothetical protein
MEEKLDMDNITIAHVLHQYRDGTQRIMFTIGDQRVVGTIVALTKSFLEVKSDNKKTFTIIPLDKISFFSVEK